MKFMPAALTLDVTSWQCTDTGVGVRFTHPNPAHKDHWDLWGFSESNDHSVDVIDWYGIRVATDGFDAPIDAELTLFCSLNRFPRAEVIVEMKAVVRLVSGEPSFVSFDRFGIDDANKIVLRGVLGVELSAPGVALHIATLQLVAARELAIAAPVLGKPIACGGEAHYSVALGNATPFPQQISVHMQRRGWEVLSTHVLDFTGEECGPLVFLEPGECRELTVVVNDDERLPEWGREEQVLVLSPEHSAPVSVRFMTVRHSDDYTTTLRRADIDEVRHNIEQHEWARQAFARRRCSAENWVVPEVDLSSGHLFVTRNAEEADNCALVYLVTGEKRFAEKVASFIGRFSDPEHGYAALPRAGNQELVHEGLFFMHLAYAFDHMKNTDLLSAETTDNTRAAFRFFMEIIRKETMRGKISNWNLSELVGVVACAAAMEDLAEIDYFLTCPSGIVDHISKGILDDGWWFEAAIGYNLLAMGLFLQVASVIDRWGFGLARMEVPASFARVTSVDEKLIDANDRIDGLSTEIWGPSTKNTRSIEMLVDSMTPFFDDQGVIFGMNDAAEMRAPACFYMEPRYDLAYRIYRKPSLVPFLLSVAPEERDPYYGVGELPALSPRDLEVFRNNAYADVAGITMLRSRTPGRSLAQQYQVTVKTGILGGAHGHYDRLALNSIRRFGKNFYNPESIWYAYHTFMYKFYVQNSITHNMTTVDLKQQDPAESHLLATGSEDGVQYAVHEITTKWCNPPYGGWMVKQGETFADRCWAEGRSLVLPADQPPYTRRTGFTEPIVQRRATIVTDDYIVLIDHLEGTQRHQFDCLFHVSGLNALTVPDATGINRMSPDPVDSNNFAIGKSDALQHLGWQAKLDASLLGSGQFITDCHRFRGEGVVTAHFEVNMSELNDLGWFAKIRTAYNSPGPMKLDIHSVTPGARELVIGCDPEYYQTQQQLYYRVVTGGTTACSGHLGPWVFGREDLEVELDGADSLVLQTESTPVSPEYEDAPMIPEPCVFWGDGVVITAEGHEISLSELPVSYHNIVPVPHVDRDYEGGPVKLEMRSMDHSLPGTPADLRSPGIVRVDLGGLRAVRLRVAIGGDYPIGDESTRRRTLAIRQNGTEANFVTVIEQYERESAIKSISGDTDCLVVVLADGRTQRLGIGDITLAHPGFTFDGMS